jgi:hypothetical protein
MDRANCCRPATLHPVRDYFEAMRGRTPFLTNFIGNAVASVAISRLRRAKPVEAFSLKAEGLRLLGQKQSGQLLTPRCFTSPSAIF